MRAERLRTTGVILAALALICVLGTPYFYQDPHLSDPGQPVVLVPPTDTSIVPCTGSDPFIQIRTAAELSTMLRHGKYRLCADIQLAPDWRSIDLFQGEFDGNGFAIHGINRDLLDQGVYELPGGIFGALRGARVTNLSLTGGTLRMNGACGLLAAWAGDSIIEGVSADGMVDCADSCGLLVGRSRRSTIDRADVSGELRCAGAAGGVVGEAQESLLSDLSVRLGAGSLQATDAAGGIVGVLSGGALLRTYFSGRIRGGSSAGGIVGRAISAENSALTDLGNIEQSVALGELDSSQVGGALGYLVGSTASTSSSTLTLRDSRSDLALHCSSDNCASAIGQVDGVGVNEEHVYSAGDPLDLNLLAARGFDITAQDDLRPSIWKVVTGNKARLYWEVEKATPFDREIEPLPPISPPVLEAPVESAPTLTQPKPVPGKKLRHKKPHPKAKKKPVRKNKKAKRR